jgi:hypothetical protein
MLKRMPAIVAIVVVLSALLALASGPASAKENCSFTSGTRTCHGGTGSGGGGSGGGFGENVTVGDLGTPYFLSGGYGHGGSGQGGGSGVHCSGINPVPECVGGGSG